MIKELKKAPTKQVANGGLAGAATIIIVWAASAWGLEIPPEIASAFTVVIMALIGHSTGV